MAETGSTIADELLQLLNQDENGLSDEQISNHFGARYAELVPLLNDLLSMNRLQLFTQGGVLIYRLVHEETAAKFEGLGPEQLLVYQVCEKSGNRGIWTRDIKLTTNIPQHTLTKTLKILEQRNLIKSVRSVVSKSKKLYMLYDVMPAKEITGMKD
jgi:DNA-directed RNA polymerase III subunit RPC6